MESAVEALKMAAAVLIFVIAIFSSFSLFGTAKQTADSIIRIRDKQVYLQAADLDGGILYTSARTIKGEGSLTEEQVKDRLGVTIKGDRIVEVGDIISTIYRYYIEKYGVTIMDASGNIIARYDSSTEARMNSWNTYNNSIKQEYVKKLNKNTDTDYVVTPRFNIGRLQELYRIKIEGRNSVGSPWYGSEEEIRKRIASDLMGETCTYNINTTYEGKNILPELNGKIVEVIKEIDNSTYLEDGGNKTNLLKDYALPTIEVIYIIL